MDQILIYVIFEICSGEINKRETDYRKLTRDFFWKDNYVLMKIIRNIKVLYAELKIICVGWMCPKVGGWSSAMGSRIQNSLTMM